MTSQHAPVRDQRSQASLHVILILVTEEIQETLLLDTVASDAIGFGPGSVLRQRYRLDSELGRGGMGVVYRATDLELKRQVAVKVLPERVSTPDARERFLREARAAAALNHPNIVVVHDVGEDQGILFFVMELVEGSNLKSAPPTDFSGIIEIALKICDALEHAHAHSFVHRDLKPENVLISGAGGSGSGGVKLADLGLAITGERLAVVPGRYRTWDACCTWRPSKYWDRRLMAARTFTRLASCSTRWRRAVSPSWAMIH